ncbi:hypothetical protein ABL78_4591 [Leptomonas seymouri]|uniref:Uncharacterized protein n=1 Tax=Leptomonas seymouri TaxID=5684 RepID=A0A0N1HWE7_LEPSE|nr:hypothetical protein ABL78_4591 [Leptomonas seymouri]|eukprot:KPI86365.1 hypothetical protein ABL78_4591 [Leptomonas seymouri]
MSDVLGYMNEVIHRVSATFMPTEMEDVASFLCGDAWSLVSAHTTQARGSGAALGEANADPSASTTAREVRAPTTLLRYPFGATRWGRFIPLGIVGTSLISAATSGSRAVLLNFFESRGFSQVFTVSLVPTEQQQLSGSTAPSLDSVSSSTHPFQLDRGPRVGGGAVSRKRRRLSEASPPACASAFSVVDVALDGRYGTTAQAARHACMVAVRQWFEDLEESLREEADDDDEDEARRAANAVGERGAQSPTTAAAPELKTQLRRLLVLVRCCADNRAAVSTRAGGAHTSSSTAGGGGVASFSSGPSGRRHRKGDDPLPLFLHDLAALTTLYEARLSATTCSVRPAVLLLPEDESFGGAILEQSLKEEVGYRYWVQLFLHADQRQHQQPTRGEGAAGDTPSLVNQWTGAGESWKASLVGRSAANRNGGPQPLLHHRQGEAPLVRGCRLAVFWGVLDFSVLASGADAAGTNVSDVSHGESTDGRPLAALSLPASRAAGAHHGAQLPHRFDHASAEQLEEALRRHPACFFARPSNAPLCVFLMESLRRFPLLVPPRVLRHWQSTWTARHSLHDLLCIFHATVCPFTMSAANQDAVRPASSPSSSLLRDATDLLDALLDASFTLAEDRDRIEPLSANDFHKEQAITFMLMYEALVQQRESRLRRIPGVVEVLERLYRRHTGASATPHPAAFSQSPADPTATDERIRYAIRHLLPFAPLNVFNEAVQQCSPSPTTDRQAFQRHEPSEREVKAYPMNSLVLPLRRMSVAPQLQSTTLQALLPPEASLLELKEASDRLWEEGLHASASSIGHAGRSLGNTPAYLSPENFFHPRVPHAVRALYLLTAHALHARTEAAKQVPVVQLQTVCQLTDEQLLLVLKELQTAGLATTNLKTQTARTLLDSI